MMITNATHFLDAKGCIAPASGSARHMAEFVGAVIALATHPDLDADLCVHCHKKRCKGIVLAVKDDAHRLLWRCTVCDEAGMITEWQNTLWDLTRLPSSAFSH